MYLETRRLFYSPCSFFASTNSTGFLSPLFVSTPVTTPGVKTKDSQASRAQLLQSRVCGGKMAGIIDVPKPRINCSMLLQHINQAVCFVCRVSKVGFVRVLWGLVVTGVSVTEFLLCVVGSSLREDVHGGGRRGEDGDRGAQLLCEYAHTQQPRAAGTPVQFLLVHRLILDV